MCALRLPGAGNLAACLLALTLALGSMAARAESGDTGDVTAQLVAAVRKPDRQAALALLQKHVDVNAASSDGTTALHWAAYNADADLVKRLLKAGANANAKNRYGATPMSEAAERGDVAILKSLLAAGADVGSVSPQGQTALMTVARGNRVDAARLLIARGADVNARETWRGQTALMWAAAQGQPEMVKLLISKGADVNARSQIRVWARKITAEPRAQNRPPGGFTALLLAAREGCAACASELVAGGADIDLADPENITPLLMAAMNGRFDVAAYLVRAGANPNTWDTWGRAPLYASIDYNIVPRGSRPDRPSSDDTTPLQLALLLLKAGANPNMQLKLFPPLRSIGGDRGGDSVLTAGSTPLLRAAKAGDVLATKLLLEHGALPDLPNDLGVTPFMAAAGIGSTSIDTRGRFRNEAQCVETGKLLLAAGADVNAARDNGQTALHGAALWGWNEYVRFLAANGADLQARDKAGLTALDIALGKAGTTGRASVASPELRAETAVLLRSLAAPNSRS